MQSNERILEWSLMDIVPGCQFNLHAHPNIELVYWLYGELHEVRMDGKPITKTFLPIIENNNDDDDDDETNQDEKSNTTTQNNNEYYMKNIPVSGPSMANVLSLHCNRN